MRDAFVLQRGRRIPVGQAALTALLLSSTQPSPAVSQTPADSTALADSAQVLWDAAMAEYETGTPAGLQRALGLWTRESELKQRLGYLGEAALTLLEVGDIHQDLGRRDSALVYYRNALAMAREGGDRTVEGLALNGLGLLHQDLGRPDSALVHYRGLLAIRPEVGDRSRQGSTLSSLGSVHQDLGRPDSALVYFEQVLAIRRELGDRSGEGTTLTSLGSVHQDLGRPDSALAYYGEALALAREVGDHSGEGLTLNNLSVLHEALGRRDSALIYGAAALAIHREVGDRPGEGAALNNLGAIHAALGRPDSALAYYGEALAIRREVGHRSGEGVTLNNLGLLQHALGRPDSALAYYGAALAIAREVGDRRGEGAALNNFGFTHAARGRPDSALAYYGEVLAIRREMDDRSGEGTTLNNLGSVHGNLGRPDSALVYFGEALAIAREVRDRSGEGMTLNNLGGVHNRLGRPDSAVVYWGEALVIAREVGDRSMESTVLSNLSGMLDDAGWRDSALVYYREALAIDREVGDRAGEGIVLNNIGLVYQAIGRPDSALVYFGEALAISREVGNRSGEGTALHNIGAIQDDLGRPDSALAYYGEALAIRRELGDRSGEGTTLNNIGYLYHRSLTTPDLSTAVSYYDSSAVAEAGIAKATGSDANRLSYAEQGLGLVEAWTLAWLALGVEADSEAGELAALAASEHGRSQALLDLMRGTQVLKAGRDMTAEGHRLIAPLTSSGVPGLSWMVTQDTLLTWLIEASGEVHVARRSIGRDSVEVLVADFRLGLGVDEAVDEARLAGSLGPRLESARGTESRRRGGESGAWPSESALSLSELLIPDEFATLMPEAGELVLVPHGPLNLIPFGTLPVGEEGESLGARYALRYTPSLATLGEAEARPVAVRNSERTRLPKAVVVGNPGMPEVPGVNGPVSLSPLPGAEAEGRWVAALVATDILTGPGATERTVREQLPEASLIHLATHGFAYSTEARARDSFVALAPDEGHDGLLTVGEVLDDPALELAAELVVLSACQTGLGDLKQSEGTVGLQRAFLARGARSVLVSLWSVSDEATDLLMRGFYRHWLEDEDAPSKAEALRRAQEDVRATPGFEHPRFWAAFQLVGAR